MGLVTKHPDRLPRKPLTGKVKDNEGPIASYAGVGQGPSAPVSILGT